MKPGGGSMIRIQVNGRDRELPEPMAVAELLSRLELHPATVVVELNGEILHRDRLDRIQVQEGDRLELVHFVGGG